MSRAYADHVVHIWLGFESLLDVPANAVRFTALMSEDELARDRRFLVEPARRLHRLTRGLQREMLASYLPGTSPRELSFISSATGRPALAPPFDAGGLRFQSRAYPWAGGARGARGATVGIDVEIYDKKVPLEVAPRFFSRVEAR